MFHFAQLPVEFDYWYFTFGILMFGSGLALSATPATVAITAALPESKQGVASAMNDTAREVGSAIGIAILGAALTETYKTEIAAVAEKLPAELGEKVSSSVAFTQVEPPAQLEAQWPDLVSAGLEAFNAGVESALTIAGWVSLMGAVLIVLLAPSKKNEKA